MTFRSRSGGVERLTQESGLLEASLHLPEGAYTTLRTYGGRGVVRLAQHVARLNETAALLGRAQGLSEAETRSALAFGLAATAFAESRVRLTWAAPDLYVTVEPFDALPDRLYEEGVRCATLDVRRENPHAKDTRFIATAFAAQRGLPAGVHEGLLVAEDGAILEGLSSNFFAVRNGELRTEETRVLAGVTRSLVLEVAQGLLPVQQRAVTRDEVDRVSEAFITSVSRGLLPVVAIDTSAIGDGRPGPKTGALRRRFDALVAREVQPV